MVKNPNTGKPYMPEEWNRQVRVTAGLPEWDMDDPGRPFTEEYDDPAAVSLNGTTIDMEVSDQQVEQTDKPELPSDDNRELYVTPSPERLRDIKKRTKLGHVAAARAEIDAGIERSERAQAAEQLPPRRKIS